MDGGVMSKAFCYTTAVVRGIAPSLPEEAQRMAPELEPVSYERALQQHKRYIDILRDEVGLRVIELPTDHSQPDCVFVEDPVVAIGGTAVITTPGHESRQNETAPMAECLRNLGLQLIFMKEENPEARLDGGDVLFTGAEIFVGIGSRTNKAGCEVLANAFPYPVSSVPVEDGLHLKSACSLAGPGIILQAVGTPALNKMATSLQVAAKKKYSYIDVEGIPMGANCLYINSPKLGPVIIHQPFDIFPQSQKAYESLKDVTRIVCDSSELGKVDGALTCCSVLLTI